MPIPVEAFIVNITGAAPRVHGWTVSLVNQKFADANRIWTAATGNRISFDLGGRVNTVSAPASQFPSGTNWVSEQLRPGRGRQYSILNSSGIRNATAFVGARWTRYRIRLILLPTAQMGLFAGQARIVQDYPRCICLRPRDDGLADIVIAHEMGHILLGPTHHPLATNLMFFEASNVVRPPQIDGPQLARAVGSRIFRHWQQQQLQPPSTPPPSQPSTGGPSSGLYPDSLVNPDDSPLSGDLSPHRQRLGRQMIATGIGRGTGRGRGPIG